MRKLASSNELNAAQLLAICPVHYTMTLLSGRWKIALLWESIKKCGAVELGGHLQRFRRQ